MVVVGVVVVREWCEGERSEHQRGGGDREECSVDSCKVQFSFDGSVMWEMEQRRRASVAA